MKPIIALQIVSRAVLWIFILSGELIASEILNYTPSTHLYYIATISITAALFLMTFRLGESGLIRDIRELCFYDILIQCFGLARYQTEHFFTLYLVLCIAVVLLKFTRLLWHIRNTNGDALANWPVFGLIGYFHEKMTRLTVAAPQLAVSSKQNRIAYAYILGTLPLAYIFHFFGIKVTLAFWAVVSMVIILLFYKSFITYLEEQYAQHVSTAIALAAAETTAKTNAALAASALALAAKNAELLEANRERDVLLAELAKRNEILRDASHDLNTPIFWIESCARGYISSKGEKPEDAAALPLMDSIGHLRGALFNTIENAKLATQIGGPKITAVPVNILAANLRLRNNLAAELKGIRFDVYRRINIVTENGDVMRDGIEPYAPLDFSIATVDDILIRILGNLITNAMRHTTAGGIQVAFRKRHDRTCWIEVRDSGSGIIGADGPDWEANFLTVADNIKQGKAGAKESVSHGLGINNVKSLCAMLGTPMMLYSRRGHGSIFRFVVPLADDALMSATSSNYVVLEPEFA
jgi:signal transduction histidine kinase